MSYKILIESDDESDAKTQNPQTATPIDSNELKNLCEKLYKVTIKKIKNSEGKYKIQKTPNKHKIKITFLNAKEKYRPKENQNKVTNIDYLKKSKKIA